MSKRELRRDKEKRQSAFLSQFNKNAPDPADPNETEEERGKSDFLERLGESARTGRSPMPKSSEGATMARRAAGGMLLGGPLGALIGMLTTKKGDSR
jgi:hypothetical protein